MVKNTRLNRWRYRKLCKKKSRLESALRRYGADWDFKITITWV